MLEEQDIQGTSPQLDKFKQTISKGVIVNDSELNLRQEPESNDAEKQRIIETEEETEGLF